MVCSSKIKLAWWGANSFRVDPHLEGSTSDIGTAESAHSS